MIKQKVNVNVKNQKALRRLLVIGLIVLVGVCVTCWGAAIGFGALHRIWLEQFRVQDAAIDVLVTTPGANVIPETITFHFGLTNGANLATIPFAELREKLLGRIPNIRDLKIERRLPNRVTVEVIERDPAVRVAPLKAKVDTGLVADADGVVFRYSSNVSALPVIREASGPGTSPGKTLSGMAAAALRLIGATALPELAGFTVLEVDTSHADYLLATLGDYSRAKIAWESMGEDSRAAHTSLTNQLTCLARAMRTRLISQPTIWNATNFDKPVHIYAIDPTRSAGQ